MNCQLFLLSVRPKTSNCHAESILVDSAPIPETAIVPKSIEGPAGRHFRVSGMAPGYQPGQKPGMY